MPHGTIIDTPICVGLAQRQSDDYIEGITIGFGFGGTTINVFVNAHTAVKIAEAIINYSTKVLNQNAAACGCDAKANWICAEHDQHGIKDGQGTIDETIES